MTVSEGDRVGHGGQFLAAAWAFRRRLADHNTSDFAAALAYRLVLSVFPFTIFATALAGFVSDLLSVGNPILEAFGRVGEPFPDEVRALLEDALKRLLETPQPGVLSVGAVSAVWLAASGGATVMRALNRAQGIVETRSWWHRSLLAVGLTLLAASSLISAFLLATAGQVFIEMITVEFRISGALENALSWARFAFAGGLLFIAVAFLYWAAPNTHLGFRLLTPGAFLFVVVWALGSMAFSSYVTRFGTYGVTYGALGGLVVIIIWFYLTSYVLLAGAELNALFADTPSSDQPPRSSL